PRPTERAAVAATLLETGPAGQLAPAERMPSQEEYAQVSARHAMQTPRSARPFAPDRSVRDAQVRLAAVRLLRSRLVFRARNRTATIEENRVRLPLDFSSFIPRAHNYHTDIVRSLRAICSCCYARNRYPTPCTVKTCLGMFGSGSNF